LIPRIYELPGPAIRQWKGEPRSLLLIRPDVAALKKVVVKFDCGWLCAHLTANPDVGERHKHHDGDARNSHSKEDRRLYDELTTKLTVRVERLVPLDKIQQRKDVTYTQGNPPLSWPKSRVQLIDNACDCGGKAPTRDEHWHQKQHTGQDIQQCRSGYILSTWLLARL
jgi:hypothetical protein